MRKIEKMTTKLIFVYIFVPAFQTKGSGGLTFNSDLKVYTLLMKAVVTSRSDDNVSLSSMGQLRKYYLKLNPENI